MHMAEHLATKDITSIPYTTPFLRSSMHQGSPISGPSEQDPLISGPSCNIDSPITGPSSAIYHLPYSAQPLQTTVQQQTAP